MIRHIVLMKKKRTATESAIEEIADCLAGLQARVEGIVSFEFGLNNSPERLGHGFDIGFTMDFADEAARDAYLPHPTHQKCVAAIESAVDDVLVFDFDF